MNVPKTIHIYSEVPPGAIQYEEVVNYFGEQLPGIICTWHNSVFTTLLDSLPVSRRQNTLEGISSNLCKARIKDVSQQKTTERYTPIELDYEQKILERGYTKSHGVVYDGFRIMSLIASLVREFFPGELIIIITNRLFGTWDYNDGRFHLRTSIYGCPCLISIPGLSQAPARSRDYYLAKMLQPGLERDLNGGTDRFLAPGDQRTTEVIKGYIWQSIFTFILGEPFCKDKHCRLFNAHWQEELIDAQIEGEYELCPHHEKIRESIVKMVILQGRTSAAPKN